MLIKWIGKNPRENSFGTFVPGRIYDVPPHIAEVLLKVKYFVACDEQGTVPVAAFAASNPYIEDLLKKIQELEAQNQALRAAAETPAPYNLDDQPTEDRSDLEHLRNLIEIEDVTPRDTVPNFSE